MGATESNLLKAAEQGNLGRVKTLGGCTPMYLAAYNLSIVKYLVENGGDVNAKSEDGRTPMHEAVRSDKLSVVKYLVENGGDVNAKDRFGETPLHKAAWKGSLSIVKYLVENGGDVNEKSNSGEIPFDQASGKSKQYLKPLEEQVAIAAAEEAANTT